MSDLIIKKNGTDYKLPMLAEHYPADRVYLNGDINKTVQDKIDEVSETASQAFNSRIEIISIPMTDTPKTITFSGKTYTRQINMFLVLTGQAGVGAPISISFGGAGDYENIGSVMVSSNIEGVTANAFSLTLPVEYYGWGFYTFIRLHPDDEITYTIS